MEHITIGPGVVNPPLLAEELEAALGLAVTLTLREEAGQLIEARLERADGLPLSAETAALAWAIAAAHDPTRPSREQAAERGRQLTREAALARLSKVDPTALGRAFEAAEGSDALRESMVGLAELLADLITLVQTERT